MLERLALVGLLALLAACDSRGAARPAPTPAAPATAARAPAAAAPALTTAYPGALPTQAPSPTPGDGSEQAAAQLAEAMGALNRAMVAMREAAEGAGGEGACEHGYLSRVAADRARNRVLDENPLTTRAPRPRWVIATHDRFVALCESLPESLRPCTAFERYQRSHEVCEASVDALPPAQRRAWDELFREEARP